MPDDRNSGLKTAVLILSLVAAGFAAIVGFAVLLKLAAHWMPKG